MTKASMANNSKVQEQEQRSVHYNFGMEIVNTLDRLPHQTVSLVKIKIMELLYEYQYGYSLGQATSQGQVLYQSTPSEVPLPSQDAPQMSHAGQSQYTLIYQLPNSNNSS
jgi:hypothetical protein